MHAHDEAKRNNFLNAFQEFIINFRAGVQSLLAQAKQIVAIVPDWAFPPPLPLKAAGLPGTA